MSNFLTDLVKAEPHSLKNIMDSLEVSLANRIELIPLLKEHHNYLKESISVLTDKKTAAGDKQIHLIRFFRLFEMHGKAEQETLYEQLKSNREIEARLEGYGGQDEHDMAFQLEDELLQMGYLINWNEKISAKANVVASLIRNHIREEENIMFPIAEKFLSPADLDYLRPTYIEKCKESLKNSAGLPENRWDRILSNDSSTLGKEF